jgi:hypothetical protein
VAGGAPVGAVLTATATIVEKTSTIVSCKTAVQRSRGSTAFGSIDFEGVAIDDGGNEVQSISFFIGRLAASITLLGA